MHDSCIVHTDNITNLGGKLVNKFHLREHIGCIFSNSVSMLSLILALSLCCYIFDNLLKLYLVLVRPKLVYPRIVSNFVTPDEAKEMEGIQQKLAALY
jgi:hypothetical protein